MEPPVASTSAGCCHDGKIFVGGISRETSEDTLKEYFKKFGEVKNAIVMRNRYTGIARGFGFVSFFDPSSAEDALNTRRHEILGKMVEVKKAVPRGEQLQNHHNRSSSKGSSNCANNNQFRTKKIFVGGLSANISEFRSYFEKFGKIADVIMMYDNLTHRPRGFGFITFDSEEAVEKALQKTFHELNGKLVEAKKAVPKNGNTNSTSPNIHNGRGYNPREHNGVVFPLGNYQEGYYPPYSPMYGMVQGYLPPPISNYVHGAGTYGGRYALGAYGGLGYGSLYAGLRSPWHVPVMGGANSSPILHGNAAFYPAYLNGGVGSYSRTATGGYHGLVAFANAMWNWNGDYVHTSAVGATGP